MDDQLASEESTLNKTWTEVFDEALPFFLNVGMTYDQFWDGDCHMTRAYFKAWKLKEERESMNFDLVAFYIGSYVMEAIGATFGKSKYPRRPHSYKEAVQNNLTEEERAELWLRSFESSFRNLPKLD